jgi:putative transposase
VFRFEKLFDNWFDPIETELRTKVRGLIEAMIEEELEVALARPRYGRQSRLFSKAIRLPKPQVGFRSGSRFRALGQQ